MSRRVMVRLCDGRKRIVGTLEEEFLLRIQQRLSDAQARLKERLFIQHQAPMTAADHPTTASRNARQHPKKERASDKNSDNGLDAE